MPWLLHRWVSLSELSIPLVCLNMLLSCGVCFLLSGSIRCHFHLWGLNHWGLHHHSPSGHTHGRHMSILVIFWGPHQECSRWLLPPLFESRESLMLLSQLYSSHSSNMVGILLGGLGSPPIPLSSLHGWEGYSFPGLVLPNDTVNSKTVLGMKPGDSIVVIVYQVDEFTHTWSAVFYCSITHLSWFHREGSHIPSSLTLLRCWN